MKISLSGLVLVGSLAACSAAADPVTGNDELVQRESWGLRDGEAMKVAETLKGAGVTGVVQSASFPGTKDYAADVRCDRADAATLADLAREGSSLAVDGTPASTLCGALAAAGVPTGNAPFLRVNVRCRHETFVNGTSAWCTAFRDVDKAAPNERTFATGTGALLSVGSLFRQVDHPSGFAHETTYELTYDDVHGYFPEADRLDVAVVKVTQIAHHGGFPDAPVTSQQPVSLAKVAPHKYKGTFVVSLPGGFGDWQTNMLSITAAFHVGDKWDSNFGQNYGL